MGVCGIIIKRDCDRYALKREVAAETGRFFRGVWPISNRAKEYFYEREPALFPRVAGKRAITAL